MADKPEIAETDTLPDGGPGIDSADAPYMPGVSGRNTIGEPMEGVKTGEASYVYNMNHQRRGLCLIISNKNFDPRTRMGMRNGTDLDAANLYQRFKALGFDMSLHTDVTAKGMKDLVAKAAEYDHSTCDCFAMCVMSHGDDGIIYGTDGVVEIDKLVEPFKGNNCKSLIGKPKLFFLQACRGDKLDAGVEFEEVESDADAVHKIPSEADILMAYSVVPGYFSWRNSSRGSWFCQALSKVLEQYGKEKEILWLMTRVNYLVAYDFESNASKAYMNKKKQIPCITSMLTKELYFHPKA